jgi:hypothetical protein
LDHDGVRCSGEPMRIEFLLEQTIDQHVDGERRTGWTPNTTAMIKVKASRAFDE